MSSTEATDHSHEISTADQDAKWGPIKLIVLGAFSLALALIAIYSAASIIGE